VKNAIRGRELFTLDALGGTVQGTCYLPHDEGSSTQGKLRDIKPRLAEFDYLAGSRGRVDLQVIGGPVTPSRVR
jgi:hypothetical protein